MSLRLLIDQANAILPGVAAPEGAHDPRWRAIIAIGDHVETAPEEIWSFVASWGVHPDEDLRTAIACCLLEHLLEYHFDLIFPRVQELVEKEPLFVGTFAMCSKFGQSKLPENSSKFDALNAWCHSR
jgi:hypothetical protein